MVVRLSETANPHEGNSLGLDAIKELIRPLKGPTGRLPARAAVVIVGAGPVGLTAANLLGRLGVDTLVLERATETSNLPKATVLDDEYMRLLDRLELADQMEGNTPPPFGIHFISPLGFAPVKVPGFVTQNGFGNRSSISQPVFEKFLLEAVQEHPSVTVRYASEVVDLQTREDGATLTVLDKSGRSKSIAAKYVLACDGARSPIREGLKIPFVGNRIDQPHLVVDLADFPDQVPYSRFRCDPRGPVNSVPAPYGGRRVEFKLKDSDDHDEVITPAGVARLFEQYTDYDPDNIQIVRSAVYTFAARVAERLQEGPVFLLGDAAHTMPPFGAQGLNTGARDASNLCWKLAAVLEGRAPASLLETYEPERRPHIEAVVRYSVGVGRLANLRSWPGAVLRDVCFGLASLVPPIRRYFNGMRYMPKPRLVDGLIDGAHAEKGLVGRLIPRVTVSEADGGQRPLDDVMGAGFALLALGDARAALAAALQSATLQSLVTQGIAVATTGPPAPAASFTSVALSDGVVSADELVKHHDGQLLLVRPDRYVALAAAPNEFDAAVGRFSAALDRGRAERPED